MTKEETAKRMANPTKPSDYGLSITFETPKERDEIFRKMTKDLINDANEAAETYIRSIISEDKERSEIEKDLEDLIKEAFCRGFYSGFHIQRDKNDQRRS